MNTLEYEILSAIDKIDVVTMEAEMNVLTALCNEYEKSMLILEHYEGEDVSCFDIFQEGFLRKLSYNIIHFPEMMMRLFRRLLNKIKSKCKREDEIKIIIEKMKKKMTEEEVSDFIHYFGNESIKMLNNDIVFYSVIDINELKLAVETFRFGTSFQDESSYEHLENCIRPSRYTFSLYSDLLNSLKKDLEDIMYFTEADYQHSKDSDRLLRDGKESDFTKRYKETYNRWFKVITIVEKEINTVSDFISQIRERLKEIDGDK